MRATVGLQIVFSEGVASRGADGALSPLDVASFRIVTPNRTQFLEARMRASTVGRRARRRLLDAEVGARHGLELAGLGLEPSPSLLTLALNPSPSPSPSPSPNPNPAEAYVREAVIVLGLPAAPGDDDLVGLSVLEGRVVDQQGNAMAGGPPAWTNLKPESPEGPGCPWLG